MGPFVSLLLPLATAALHFLGDQACPRRAEVEEQLRRIDSDALRPDALRSDIPKDNHFALLEPGSAGLEVRLYDESGNLLERRFLGGQKSCADWARIAAALLATWETDLVVPDLPLSDQTSTAAPPEAPAVVATVPGAETQAHPLRMEVGLGAGPASADANAFAASGTLLVGLGPARRAFGARLALEATTFQSLPVGVGAASWQRTALSLGGYGTFGVGEWKLELGGALMGGILTASGIGFEVARTGTALEPGFEICPRLRWDFARDWRAWAQLGAAIWFQSETVRVLADSQSGTCCGGACVDLASDPLACGYCGLSCGHGGLCEDGFCIPSGSPHCGSDAGQCAPGLTCISELGCLSTSCSQLDDGARCLFGVDPANLFGVGGVELTLGICCGQRCVDPQQDLDNCGGCGMAASGPECSPGSCIQCVDLASDPGHCGNCSIACPAGQTRSAGVCSGSPNCGPGRWGAFCDPDAGLSANGLSLLCCPGLGCDDVTHDSQNCGSCGSVCPVGESCTLGTCG